MIFTQGNIQLEPSPKPPKFFSTTITNELKVFTHLHCLITYEKITPNIVQESKDRLGNLKNFKFLNKPEHEEILESVYYVPVALCLTTSSSFVDIFREILESLYSFFVEISLSDKISKNQLIVSMEFMRVAVMLINDVVIPPEDITYTLKIGGKVLKLPENSSIGLSHNEKAVAVLMDLMDIQNIIEIWECILLGKTVFFCSCDEYILYLVLDAFKQIIFPFKWPYYIIPVLGPNLIDYLAVPVPILVGFNTTLISVQEALYHDPKACVLDIDSNILHSTHESLICNCEKISISKKLQLIKTHYYVDYERFRTYRMNFLEISVQDSDFLNTLKNMMIRSDGEKEKIFVELVRNVFLDFFTTAFENFKKNFKYDSLTQMMEFRNEEFLASIKTCENCSMEEFWKIFIQSSTFSDFLNTDDKSDNSTLKRFVEILNLKAKKQYKIIRNFEFPQFDVEKTISPRKFLQILKQDQILKEKNFFNDSRMILLVELKRELESFKEYYRMHEGVGKYPHRKVSFSNAVDGNEKGFYSIYYGKFGIARLSSLLLANIEPVNMRKLSSVSDHILPKIDLILSEKVSWPVLLLKLLYIVKLPPDGWPVEEIMAIFNKIKSFEDRISASKNFFTEVLSIFLIHHPDQSLELFNFGGSLSLLTRRIKIQKIDLKLVDESCRNSIYMIDKNLMKMNTCRNNEPSIKRSHNRNQTQMNFNNLV
jgi:hypothetical protein